MIITVSAQELANQLVKEIGINRAMKQAEFWSELCFEEKPRKVWLDVVQCIKRQYFNL